MRTGDLSGAVLRKTCRKNTARSRFSALQRNGESWSSVAVAARWALPLTGAAFQGDAASSNAAPHPHFGCRREWSTSGTLLPVAPATKNDQNCRKLTFLVLFLLNRHWLVLALAVGSLPLRR